MSILSRLNVIDPTELFEESIEGLPADQFEGILIMEKCLDNGIDYLQGRHSSDQIMELDQNASKLESRHSSYSHIKG